MSVDVLNEQNPGPLKLEYDMTPREVRNSFDKSATSKEQNLNFRFKGYPEKNFETSKHPITGLAPDDTELQGVKLREIQGGQIRSRKQYFDTRHPRAFGSPKGLQYGSSDLPVNQTSPQPIRGSLRGMNQSSAEMERFQQHQEEASDEIRQLKQERLQAMMNASAEKKADMDMLRNYDPWGKAGGGAPNHTSDNRKQKFTEPDCEKIKPSPGPTNDFAEEYGDQNTWFGRQGAGAPLRTGSGQIKTQLKGAQDIRFLDTQKGRNVYDVEVRYQKDPIERFEYGKDLEKQIASKQLESQERRIRDLKEELAMMRHDPYGRPGAGAPNKSKSEADRRALLNAKLEADASYDPWGKGVGQPTYDRHGDLKRHPNTKRHEGVFTEQPFAPLAQEQGNTLPLSGTRGGGGAPILDESAEFGKQTRLPILMKRDEKGDTTFREDMPGLRRRPPRMTPDDAELQIYHPFGRSGAGAPVRDQRGNVITTVFGNFNNASTYRKNSPKVKEAARPRDPRYINELQRDSERFRQQRQSQDKALKYGAGDFASEITRGQVGFPRRDPHTGMITNHHLPSTDVTREKANVHSLKTHKTEEYHNELRYMEEQRSREEKLEKLRERQEARHHGKSQNDYWGRPGGGAPIAQEHKKANLDNILYQPRLRDEQSNGERTSNSQPNGVYKDYLKASNEPEDFYTKVYRSESASRPTNYVRTTVGSNHANMFDLSGELRRQRAQDYHLPKPFATEGTEVL